MLRAPNNVPSAHRTPQNTISHALTHPVFAFYSLAGVVQFWKPFIVARTRRARSMTRNRRTGRMSSKLTCTSSSTRSPWTKTFSLDEHHVEIAEVGLNHVDFLRYEPQDSCLRDVDDFMTTAVNFACMRVDITLVAPT